jgi:hypothetical protein
MLSIDEVRARALDQFLAFQMPPSNKPMTTSTMASSVRATTWSFFHGR